MEIVRTDAGAGGERMHRIVHRAAADPEHEEQPLLVRTEGEFRQGLSELQICLRVCRQRNLAQPAKPTAPA
jgi:hypothetical protein